MPARARTRGAVVRGPKVERSVALDGAPPAPVRQRGMAAEEERIAQAALAELPEGGVVVLDAGTVTECLAARLPLHHGYTVVTNSLSVASVLAARTDLTVHLIGGRLDRRAGAALATSRELEGLHADVAFVVPAGVSFDRGLTSTDPVQGRSKRALMDAARTVVALADHTRVDHDHMSRFAHLGDIDCLITDTGLAPDSAARLGTRVLRLLRA
ncbi:DeoR family fructose operon transcriptional repressor [Nocardiopsis sp. Huas11]|uniref:DeoR/GlpR family DNA-binding transcription regulator n=1 Tax=Nocardiopsis sp. Huas11 TaxID=2183912 RepID=UPI000F1D7A2C|nr:DeoR family transcriptional regulator [Nocardiopsis sp. Huas11]RKS08307.1 DeoR family fructose operon transcriptional repressor [Nocardiopsis sp. Huas11]